MHFRGLRKTLLFVLLASVASEAAAPALGGNASLTSSYIFRGIRQFHGVAFQGTAEIAWNRWTAGLWTSNVELESGSGNEIDPYLKFGLVTGNVAAELGITAYAYDFHAYDNSADFEFEAFGSVSFKSLSVSVYVVPPQKSTEGGLSESCYWIEIGGDRSVKSLDLAVGCSFGTYSSRFLAIPKKDAVGFLSIAVSKRILNPVILSWNAVLPAADALDRQFWTSLEVPF